MFTAGFFDPPHRGHAEHLREAKKLGDQLIVLVHRDECVPPSTLVETPEGVKRISEVNIGDEVIGTSVGICTAKLVREYEGELVKIKARYLPAVYFTPNHPILVRKMNIYQTRRKGKRPYVYKLKEFEWIEAGRVVPSKRFKKLLVVVPKDLTEEPYIIRLKSLNPYAKKDRIIELNEEFAKLLGLWFAEGTVYISISKRKHRAYSYRKLKDGTIKRYPYMRHTRYHRVCFSFGKHEKELVKWCVNILKKYGFNPFVAETRTALVVWLNSGPLARWLKAEFGCTAREKRIPHWLFKERKRIIKAFIEGVLIGDGWTDGYHHRIALTNKIAILGLHRLLRKLGIMASYTEREITGEIEGRKLRKTMAYAISWTNIKRKMFFEDERYYYLPVERVEKVPYKGKVYNLETTTETYGVPFIVHNCCIRKKGYCFMPLEDRKALLESMRWVDKVIVCPEECDLTAVRVLRELKPDIFARGGDRTPENMPKEELEVCEELGIKIIYNVGGGKVQSSSWLCENFIRKFRK